MIDEVFEDNKVTIARDKNNVKLWIRSAEFESVPGLKLIDSMKSIFDRLGLKITEFTLNGEKIWSSVDDQLTKYNETIVDNNKQINKVY